MYSHVFAFCFEGNRDLQDTRLYPSVTGAVLNTKLFLKINKSGRVEVKGVDLLFYTDRRHRRATHRSLIQRGAVGSTPPQGG